MKNKLLIIGPDLNIHGVGGVTIHVLRLRDYLDSNKQPYRFCDYKCNNYFVLLREIYKIGVIHLHVSNPVYMFILTLTSWALGKKIVITLHGNYGRFGKMKNWLVKVSIKLATIPIVINKQSYDVCRHFNKKTTLIPAFIPPQKEVLLQTDILAIINRLREEGKKIISTNASNVAYDKLGNEIYGIDFLVQFFKYSSDMALVVSDPSGNYEKKYRGLVSKSVFFINYPHSYFEVLKRVDYSVRNTSTDGDALSVKESLYLGKPTLCTDVVDRPKGVRLFKYCDKLSFEKCLNCDNEENVILENGAERIVQVYNSIVI